MERKWWTLIVVCVATFMLLLDITIVNVALPSIQTALHSNFQDLQWVVDAYSLTLAALLLTAGSLADLLGRKRVFTVGLAIFTGASLICGLSTTPLMLNLARGVQGIGGAAMLATSLALIAQEFQGRERGTAYRHLGRHGQRRRGDRPDDRRPAHPGARLGVHLLHQPADRRGGDLPSITQVRDTKDPDATGVDWAGLVTFSSGLFLLVLALIRGNDAGWGSTQIVVELVAAAVLLLLFVVVEVRQKRPMLDITLFRKPTFSGAAIAAFAVSASLFAMFLYITLYFQNVLGYTPARRPALRFLPLTVVAFFIAPIAGRLSDGFPARALMGHRLRSRGGGPAADARGQRRLDLDHAAGRVRRGRGRPRHPQPDPGPSAVGVMPRARSGMASGINNTGRQVGVRHRDRRPRGAVPARGAVEGRRASRGHARGTVRSGTRRCGGCVSSWPRAAAHRHRRRRPSTSSSWASATRRSSAASTRSRSSARSSRGSGRYSRSCWSASPTSWRACQHAQAAAEAAA